MLQTRSLVLPEEIVSNHLDAQATNSNKNQRIELPTSVIVQRLNNEHIVLNCGQEMIES